jgi:hypothetical protein
VKNLLQVKNKTRMRLKLGNFKIPKTKKEINTLRRITKEHEEQIASLKIRRDKAYNIYIYMRA